MRGRCLGALRLGFVMLGVPTLRELWELWESSGRGVESCGSLGVVFYVSAKLREAQSVVFYVSGKLWETQSVVFYMSGRLWEPKCVVLYASGSSKRQ